MVSRSAAMSLEERVREQGEKVRRLKAEKAPKEQVRLAEDPSHTSLMIFFRVKSKERGSTMRWDSTTTPSKVFPTPSLQSRI